MSNTTNQGAEDYITHLQTLNLQVALYKYDISGGTPTEWQAGFTEISGGGYARQSLTLTNGTTVSGVGVRTDNQNDLTFGPSTADWAYNNGTEKICGFQVFNSTSGRTVWRGVFTESMQLHNVTGQPYELKAGALSRTILTDDA